MDVKCSIDTSTPSKDIDKIDFLTFNHLGLKSIYQDNEIINEEEHNGEGLEKESTTESDADEKIPECDWLERPEDHPIIYMKQLDANLCTGFSTSRGQKMFKKAIKKKYMNIYFTMAPHFHTQQESNLCGAGTLAMALNALRVDPHRMWIYPWRWYDERMLNTCTPINVMMAKGCGFDDFGCMLRCNKLSVEAVRVSKESSLREFRKDVKLSCLSYDTVMLLNYSRGKFNQTGTGHFTPLGGYNKDNDMVLILDTARFKFPPHWVTLKLLWESLKDIAVGRKGNTDDMPRGYFLVKKNEENPSITLKFPGNYRLHFEPSNPTRDTSIDLFVNLFTEWDGWLDANICSKSDILQECINYLADMSKCVESLDKVGAMISSSQQMLSFLTKIDATASFQKVRSCLECLSSRQIRNLYVMFQNISNLIVNKEDIQRGIINIIQYNRKQKKQTSKNEINESIIVCYGVTFLILFWPYRPTENENNRKKLESFIKNDLQTFPQTFVSTIHQQIIFVKKTLAHFGHEKTYCKEEKYFA